MGPSFRPSIVVVALAVVALTAVGCAMRPPVGRYGPCGDHKDDRPWLPIAPPPGADDLRSAAAAKPVLPVPNTSGRQFWFGLPTGELMLCRSDDPPRSSCVGEWW